jgi:hypothetical protein
MSSTIDQYREAKAAYLKLQSQVKPDLLARANELAGQLAQMQQELADDFGIQWRFPQNGKRKKGQSARKPATPPAVPIEPPAPDQKNIARIERQLATQRNKLEQAQKNGQEAKAIKDRIYELEDERRLVREKLTQ